MATQSCHPPSGPSDRVLRVVTLLVVLIGGLDLSLMAGRPSQAAPPTLGIVDVLYRYTGGLWVRTLVVQRLGTGCTITDDACDMVQNCTLGRTVRRYVYPEMTGGILLPGGPETFYDETFSLGVRYRYEMQDVFTYDCVKCGQTTQKQQIFTTNWQGQTAEAQPAGNQTVDSRYDLRYSVATFKDFQFGSRIYRGGLFAGWAGDPSRVGRSYLKFTLPAAPAGTDGRHVSTMNAWFTRLAGTGSMNVAAHRSSDTAWDENAIRWSTAPAFETTATDTQAVSYDTDTGAGGPAWVRWKIHDDAENQYAGGYTQLTELLKSTDEAANAWAYFGKRQYESGKEPRLFVVHRFPAE